MASEVNLIVPTLSSTDSPPLARARNITSTTTSDRQWKLTQSIAEIGAELPRCNRIQKLMKYLIVCAEITYQKPKKL